MTDRCAGMISVLRDVRVQLQQSKESLYAPLTPQDIIAILDREIASLESVRQFTNVAELKSLFLPTAEIQDISLDNGWSPRYIKLSSRFDRALKSCGADQQA